MPRRPKSDTTTTIANEPAPRLPHEHDESSDSQTGAPREVIRRAHDDIEHGRVDTDRGEPLREAYERLRGPQREAPRPPAPRKRR